jgi:hypothetical protein
MFIPEKQLSREKLGGIHCQMKSNPSISRNGKGRGRKTEKIIRVR